MKTFAEFLRLTNFETACQPVTSLICLEAKKHLHRPGIEPGPPAWQASILPLNHRCAPLHRAQMLSRWVTPGLAHHGEITFMAMTIG